MIWYILTFLAGAFVGIVLLAVVSAGREEESYIRGIKQGEKNSESKIAQAYERGKRAGSTYTPIWIERSTLPIYSLKAELVVDDVDLEIGGELFMNHVKSELGEKLGEEIMKYAKISQTYVPGTKKTRVMASVYAARRD